MNGDICWDIAVLGRVQTQNIKVIELCRKIGCAERYAPITEVTTVKEDAQQ